ncbi:hypothetical protein D3C87_1964850 [compost metagenome]
MVSTQIEIFAQIGMVRIGEEISQARVPGFQVQQEIVLKQLVAKPAGKIYAYHHQFL